MRKKTKRASARYFLKRSLGLPDDKTSCVVLRKFMYLTMLVIMITAPAAMMPIVKYFKMITPSVSKVPGTLREPGTLIRHLSNGTCNNQIFLLDNSGCLL